MANQTASTLSIPTKLAAKADERALEIFEAEAKFGRTFKECIGMVYLVAMQAGIEKGLSK